MESLIYKIYSIVLLCSIAIGFFICAGVILKERKFFPFFLLLVLMVIILGVDKYALYLIEHSKQNYWLYNYYSVLETFFYTWLISTAFFQKKIKTISLQINILVFAISLINVIFFQGTKRFHTITFGIGSLQIIINCIYYFYQIFIFPAKEKLFKQPFFWFVTAILFQYVCGFPIFMLNNVYYTKVAQSIWPIIGIINDCINIIFQSLITIGFICKIKKF